MAFKEVKDRIKAAKTKHELHVLLLMEREDLSRAEATVLAYLQGYEALEQQVSYMRKMEAQEAGEAIRDLLDRELDKQATEAAFKAAGGKLGAK